jgi:hypothetical protein
MFFQSRGSYFQFFSSFARKNKVNRKVIICSYANFNRKHDGFDVQRKLGFVVIWEFRLALEVGESFLLNVILRMINLKVKKVLNTKFLSKNLSPNTLNFF